MNNISRLISLALIFGNLTTGCQNGKGPRVITLDITDVTTSSAKSGGRIIDEDSDFIISRGVCWSRDKKPTTDDNATSDGSGSGQFTSNIIGLESGRTYYVRAYATNSSGKYYGDEKSLKTISEGGQIIADHTVVDKYDDIPQYYIDQVKKMWLSYAGESHSKAVRTGLALLESQNSVYQVNVTESGTPEGFTSSHLRASRATWGDLNNSSGWVYGYGEEDWWTNSTAISRTKAGITYCNTNGPKLSAIGFGWCYDPTDGYPSATADPVYGVRWFGVSFGSSSGDIVAWGLDDDDNSITGNVVNLNTYLSATQQYIDHCAANGYDTKVFFTTGPVDIVTGDAGYQNHLKMEAIRNYVKADPSRILFDYADILCYDDNGSLTTTTWNGHTYPIITKTNLGDASIGHIGSAGAIRLAKAMWWMLARIAGWDGE